MVAKRKSNFDWLFGRKSRRVMAIPVQEQVIEYEEEEEFIPEPTKRNHVKVCNPLQADSLGNPYKYFIDIDLRTDSPVVNNKIKDYRMDDDG